MHDRRKAARDRRGGQRAPFVAAVRHQIGSEVQLALAQNLSPSGIELKRPLGAPYPPRTPVSLSFELPDGGELIHVDGSIAFDLDHPSATRSRRASDPKPHQGYQTTGVRFLYLTQNDRARIERILRRRPSTPS